MIIPTLVSVLELDIPGWRSLRIDHLVLDVNGTLALDGALLPGVVDRMNALRRMLSVHLLSSDTYDGLDGIADSLRVDAVRLRRGEPEAAQKGDFVRALGASHVLAIGNGANDVAMLREAGLGIAVLGHEGLATATLEVADVLAASIEEALDLVANPLRLVATLRR